MNEPLGAGTGAKWERSASASASAASAAASAVAMATDDDDDDNDGDGEDHLLRHKWDRYDPTKAALATNPMLVAAEKHLADAPDGNFARPGWNFHLRAALNGRNFYMSEIRVLCDKLNVDLIQRITELRIEEAKDQASGT